jgi:hypothetical protein
MQRQLLPALRQAHDARQRCASPHYEQVCTFHTIDTAFDLLKLSILCAKIEQSLLQRGRSSRAWASMMPPSSRASQRIEEIEEYRRDDNVHGSTPCLGTHPGACVGSGRAGIAYSRVGDGHTRNVHPTSRSAADCLRASCGVVAYQARRIGVRGANRQSSASGATQLT